MKKLLLILALFSSFAFADIEDDLKASTDKEYCEGVTNLFYGGLRSQQYGSARQFRELTPAIIEAMEHGLPLSKKAMYYQGWDKLTDKEKMFINRNVLEGYDIGVKIDRELTDDQMKEIGQIKYNGCLEARSKEVHQ